MIFKNLLAKIFAAWALIIFVITLIPVVLLIWIIGLVEEPKRTQIFRIISKIWMRVFFFLTGCGLKIVGANNFKHGEKYIVVCNHNSLMDVPVTTPFIPGANKTIAKAEMARFPLFGLIYRRGSVLVDRNNKNSRTDSFKKMIGVLNQGMHVCIYPEGTRNRTEMPLKEFHAGAFRLAVETGTAIMPALLFNTKRVLPPGEAFYFLPTKMEMHFLPPIPVSNTDNPQVLKEKVRQIMSEYYMKNKDGASSGGGIL